MAAEWQISTVYSFVDVQCSISGPNGSISLGDIGVSGEGIKFTRLGETNTMTIGAGGAGMHSLHASHAARVTISLFKTSPGNAILDAMFRYQRASSGTWGQNLVTLSNPITGDNVRAPNCAFVKLPDIANATEGGLMEWMLETPTCTTILGNGLQPTNTAPVEP